LRSELGLVLGLWLVYCCHFRIFALSHFILSRSPTSFTNGPTISLVFEYWSKRTTTYVPVRTANCYLKLWKLIWSSFFLHLHLT